VVANSRADIVEVGTFGAVIKPLNVEYHQVFLFNAQVKVHFGAGKQAAAPAPFHHHLFIFVQFFLP